MKVEKKMKENLKKIHKKFGKITTDLKKTEEIMVERQDANSKGGVFMSKNELV